MIDTAQVTTALDDLETVKKMIAKSLGGDMEDPTINQVASNILTRIDRQHALKQAEIRTKLNQRRLMVQLITNVGPTIIAILAILTVFTK